MGSHKTEILALLKVAFATLCIVILLVLTITPIVYSNRIRNGNLEYYTGNYSIERAEITRGWFIVMDNGEQYYLHIDATESELAAIDWLYSNQDKQITISALPSHFLTIFDKLIVSVSMGDTVLLDSQLRLTHMRIMYIVFLPISVIIIGVLIFAGVGYTWYNRLTKKPKKKRRKSRTEADFCPKKAKNRGIP